MTKCKKCDKNIDSFDYDWNGGVCNSCKIRRTIRIVLILGLIGAILGLLLGTINYNYAIGKCSDLTSSETNYGFTNTIEVNTQYSSDCYYLVNHPLARISYVFGGALLGIFLGSIIGIAIGTVTKPYGI